MNRKTGHRKIIAHKVEIGREEVRSFPAPSVQEREHLTFSDSQGSQDDPLLGKLTMMEMAFHSFDARLTKLERKYKK